MKFTNFFASALVAASVSAINIRNTQFAQVSPIDPMTLGELNQANADVCTQRQKEVLKYEQGTGILDSVSEGDF